MNDIKIKKGEDITEEIVEIFKRLRMIIETDDNVELSGNEESLIYIKGIHGSVDIWNGNEELEGDIEVRIVSVWQGGTIVFETVNTEKKFHFSLLSNDRVRKLRGERGDLIDNIFGGLEMIGGGVMSGNGESQDEEFEELLQCPKCGNFIRDECIFCGDIEDMKRLEKQEK